jgi:hypothetical protein
MNLTKQDLQKIVSRLAAYGIKDSQFKKAKSLNGDSLIAIVQDGSNATVTADQVMAFVHNSLNLNKISINIPGLKEHTLLQVLIEIYGIAKTGKGNGNNTPLLDENIAVNFTLKDGTSYTNLQDFLYYILSVLNSVRYATTEEVQNIVN